MLGLSASLLAGGVAKFLQPLPGPGQQLTKISKHELQYLSAVHPFKLDGVQFQFDLTEKGAQLSREPNPLLMKIFNVSASSLILHLLISV